MPKEIINITLTRPGTNVNWGFVVIGGKDQAMTLKVGNVRFNSPAERAGLKACDYIWTVNGKEVFEMSHNQCVDMIKKSGTQLSLATERGDHIVPNFEEIWPSNKKKKDTGKGEKEINWDYYLDAMQNGPNLSGHLPIPSNFTTVGKPNIFVNQYDSPLDVYSEETIEEMKEERLTMLNPDYLERSLQRKEEAKADPAKAKSGPKSGGGGLHSNRKFDSKRSNVLNFLGQDERKTRGQ